MADIVWEQRKMTKQDGPEWNIGRLRYDGFTTTDNLHLIRTFKVIPSDLRGDHQWELWVLASGAYGTRFKQHSKSFKSAKAVKAEAAFIADANATFAGVVR